VSDVKRINCRPRHEMQSLFETRCQHVHVRSNAASMRHTVSESVCIPYLSLINGIAVINNIFRQIKSQAVYRSAFYDLFIKIKGHLY